MRSLQLAAAIVIALAAIMSAAAPSNAAPRGQPRSADIEIEILSGGLIIGGSGGSGTLYFQGKRYPLAIGGLSLGITIGLANARLSGKVYNLRRPSDIEGTYGATDAGYALVGGRKVARLTNARGVLLVLRGRQIGVEATLDMSGMRIGLK